MHVLRHSFAATAAEMGFSELTIAGLLGHSVPGVTARYAHVPDSALVAAADRVSARIASRLTERVMPKSSRFEGLPARNEFVSSRCLFLKRPWHTQCKLAGLYNSEIQ